MQSIKDIQAWFNAPRRGKTERANLGQMRTIIATYRFNETLVAESGIEAAFCKAAEFSPYVLNLVTQPFTCQIHHDGALRVYTPDALVQTPDGYCVVECKPFWKRIDHDLREYLKSAQAMFASYGLRFVVVDELDVGAAALADNIAWLWPLRAVREFDDQAENLASRLRDAGEMTWADAQSLGFKPFEIGRALAQRLIFTDLNASLQQTSTLRATPFGDHRDVLNKLGNYQAHDLRQIISLEEVYA